MPPKWRFAGRIRIWMSEAKVNTLLRGVPQKSTDIPYHWKRGFSRVNALYYSIQIGIKEIPPGVFGINFS